MKSIKRYSLDLNEATEVYQMLEVDTGLFCLYSDYIALQQEIVATRQTKSESTTKCFLTGGLD
jgi:hypothetical protein